MRITETPAQPRFLVGTPGRDTARIYPVECRALFASLACLLSLTFCVAVVTGLVAQFVKTGFDPARIFEHVSPQNTVLLLLGAPVLGVVTAFVCTMGIRLAKVTISNGTIQGVNYWCFKKKIPLGEITRLGSFSKNGIRAIVVHSRRHGSIYVSENTHRLPELLQFLNTTIEENEKRARDSS